MLLRHCTALVAATLLSAALAVAPAGGQVFTIVTDPDNPIVTDTDPGTSHYFGTSWVDYDGDGDQDLFVDQDFLYRNDGGGDFTRVTGSGLGDSQTASNFSPEGNSWADFDNDGDLDAFLAGELSFLYENDAGSFSAVMSGEIGDGFDNRGWTCAWADFDNNGYIDVAIVHPAGFIPGGPAIPNRLYRNDGPPDYTFTRVTTGPIVTGLDSYTVGTWSDFDDDGDLDFFAGSGPADGSLDVDNLYRNLLTETGTADFERITESPIATDLQDGQVWNWIDFDNDGDLDAYLTNWGGSLGGVANRLYRQESDGSFTRLETGAIVTDADVSLASVWGDYDNDGDLDGVVVNDSFTEPDRYYRNEGDGTFTRLDGVLTAPDRPRRGGAAADYDEDGDLDLFLNGPADRRVLYRNDTPQGNAWLELDLTGTVSNRTAIGAKVRARATIGGEAVWQLRELSAHNSFNGHSSLRVHFGLGDASQVDTLYVEWPSGEVTVLAAVATNQILPIVEEGATGIPATRPAAPAALRLDSRPNPFNPHTTIRYELPARSRVSLAVHDVRGRLVRHLVSGVVQPAGAHAVVWDGTDGSGRPVASGVYPLRLVAGQQVLAARLVLVR